MLDREKSRVQTQVARRQAVHTPYLSNTPSSVWMIYKVACLEIQCFLVGHTLGQMHYTHANPRDEVWHSIIPDRILG